MVQYAPNRVGFALVLILVLQSAQAIGKCKTGCDGASGLLQLTPGTTYKYDYHGTIIVQLSSAEGQLTSTEVKANVLLTQQPDCSQVLRLQNVQVVGPDGKARTGIPDVEKPVVLNSNNGELNDFICSEQGDTQNSLNLKRAIASLFQVNTEKSVEVDVFGQCPTQVYKSQEGGITKVIKKKNLNKCAFRESVTHNYISTTFNIHSEIQSSPILNSDLDSKLVIKQGVLDSAEVIETYLFVPFSVGQNGAQATIESKLILSGTSKDAPVANCQVPKSIIFENPHPVNVLKSNVNIILKKVKEISENLGSNVDDKTAIEFVDLVKLLRVSKKADILAVYNQVRSGVGFPDKEGAKKIFLDAILAAGNGDTIEVAIELLKNKELGPLEEQQLYIGLSRARHVTENSIKTATDLINRANLPREAYLGVGALAGRYCATHSCENCDAVNKIIQKLLSKLGDLKAANIKEESDMIYVLKGLTNIGYLNEAILGKLVSLAEDKKQSARLRVATLEAFQAAPCKDKLRDSALKTLQDIQQDSEIRIKAYLVLTRCPNEKIAKAIKELLDEEESHQVGGFISTHLKDLRSSTNPDKDLARTYLGYIRPESKFIFDPRKYSFNNELSFAFDTLGAAANIERNVIYSKNSWLPRSTNLNLTAEVFGQRFNFLEIAARQENLDKVIEHYLGPQGVLRKATLQQNWDNSVNPVRNLWNTLKEKVDKSLRARRDVSQAQIDAINQKVQIKENELDKNLDLDLSIKTFGSEVVFINSFDVAGQLSPESIIDSFVNNINDGIDKLKNFEKTLRSNLLFLDAELSYPTSLGFPLRLGLDGAANIQVKTDANIDVRALLAHVNKGSDVSLKISLIPSATVSIAGRISLDTPLLENGLRVASTLHTSSGGELLVNLFKGGLGLDVKFNIPVQKQELIGLKHNIVFQTRENGVELKAQRLKFSQNKDFTICIDQLVNYVGLEFCADINGPNLSGKRVPVLPFPLSGDAKASIRIERGDIDTFHYRREFFNEGKQGVAVTLETLDKNNKKAVSLDVEGFISPESYIKATLNSPIKNGEAEARLVLTDQEKLLSVYVKDENKVYSAKAGLKISGSSDKVIYDPIIEYRTPENSSPQKPPFQVEGRVVAEKSGGNIKYTFDNIKLVVPGQKAITLNGNLGVDGPAYFTDLTASDGSISGTIKGQVQVQANLLKIQGEVRNTLNPSLNLNVKGEFKKQNEPTYLSSNLQITHGADLNSKTNVISLVNTLSLKNLKTLKDLEFSTKNKFSYPAVKVSAKLDVDKSPKAVNYDTYLQYANSKLGSDLKLKYNIKYVGDYQLQFDVYGNKDKVELKAVRIITSPDDSKIDNVLTVNGKKFEISGKIKHHVKPNDLNVGVDVIIKTPNSKTPWKFVKVNKLNLKDFDFHTKLLSGSTAIIDTLLKGNRAGNANGYIKINVKDTLSINGQIKAQKGVGSGDILVDVKSIKKSTKLETAFNIHNPIYNLDLTIYPVFNEDKNKKVALSTKNKYTGTTLDSANTLDILGTKLAVNAKGQIGNPRNGKTALDLDITLPDEQYLAAKVVREVTSNNGIWNSDNLVVLEHRLNKAAPGRTITIKGAAKNTNLKAGILDITVNALAVNGDRKINVDATVTRQKNGAKWKADLNGKLTASALEHPIEISYHREYQNLEGTFNIKVSACPKSNAQIQGNYNIDVPNGPISTDVKLDLNLPLETLSNVKITQAFLKRPQGANLGAVEISGSLQTVSSTPNLNIDTTGNLKIVVDRQTGSFVYHREVNKPIKTAVDASGSYSIDEVKKTGSITGGVKVITSRNQIIEGSGTITRISPKEYSVDAALDVPTEVFKSNKLSAHYKRTDDNDITGKVDLVSDGKKYALTSDISLNNKEPSVEIKLIYPDSKYSVLSASVKRPSESKLLANIKLACQVKNILLEAGIDANTESLNNFVIEVTANSPNLNIRNIIAKIGNAGSNDGKTLNIQITSEGKNVVSGSATVSSREEQGKFIVEGSGNFKVKNQDKSGNFKYIRTTLTLEKNGEVGEEVSFDATLGNQAIDAELKLTNKEFRYLNSYCEESKQCAHVEIDAKSSINDVSRQESELEITIDLRVLGVPNEFGLKAVTKRQNWLLDHTVDVHFENAANKYQYSVYLHPKEFGVSLTTPKRIIALEANANIPNTNIRNGGKASGEIAFYADKKNNPNVKTFLSGVLDVDVEKRTVDAELKLNSVAQTKPLSIKYSRSVPVLGLATKGSQELIIDIFANPDKKIVVTHTFSNEASKESYQVQREATLVVKSVGLGIDINVAESVLLDPKAFTGTHSEIASIKIGANRYDSGSKLVVSPKEAYLLIKYLNNVLLEVKSDISLQKGLISINSQTSGLGFKAYQTDVELKNYNTLKIVQYHKDDPNTKLVTAAGIIIGQIADVRADYYAAGVKKELFHASVKLDDKNFLQPDADVQADNIKEFSAKVKAFTDNRVKETTVKLNQDHQQLSGDLRQLAEKLKEGIPDGAKGLQFYESELSKFRDELANDKTLQDAAEILKNIFTTVASTVSRLIDVASDIVEKIVVSVNSAFADIIKTIQTQILPKLTELSQDVVAAAQALLNQVSDVVLAYLAKCAELFEAVKPQLKAIAGTISEISEEVGRFVRKTYESIRVSVTEQINHLCDEIKASPIFAELKAQYDDLVKNGLPSRETLVNSLKAITGALKEAVLVPDFQNVIDLVERYLEKKLLDKPVDDAAELEKIANTLYEAVSKFLTALSQEAVPDVVRNVKIPALNLDLLKRLPTGGVGIRVSILNYLLREDNAPILRYLVRLVLAPQDWAVPPQVRGVISSSEVFTFDDRSYYFPASCSYLLARDAVNGNFSVIASYENKKLVGITLIDKTGSITIKKESVLLNNAESDYPINKGSLRAEISPLMKTLTTTAGVDITCELNMLGCNVEISGFYHGQLRGLLGNGNRESYDDLALANGEIVSSINLVAASYAIGSCPPVPALDITTVVKSDEQCDKIFGWDSPLKLCYPIVPHEKIKRACSFSAKSGNPEAYKTYSLYYAYQCWFYNVPVAVPTEHSLPCKNSQEIRNVGDEFSVKLPGKSADVLLIINLDKNNEILYKEYVQPVVVELVNEFKAKGVVDLVFNLIVVGGENPIPSQVTVGGKTSFTGKSPNLKFDKTIKPDTLVTGCPDVDGAIAYIRNLLNDLELGITLQIVTELYPFRAEAIRTILFVSTDTLVDLDDYVPLKLIQSLLPTRKDLSFTVITTAKALKVKDPKTTKDVIGFNSENVITLTEGKTKPLGSPTLQKELSYNDLTVDHVVSIGGNVFLADNLLANKNSKQQIVSIIAKNIVSKALSKEVGLDCSCDFLPGNPFVPYNHCRVVEVKSK